LLNYHQDALQRGGVLTYNKTSHAITPDVKHDDSVFNNFWKVIQEVLLMLNNAKTKGKANKKAADASEDDTFPGNKNVSITILFPS
jgi:hypothetical protein